jgi:glycosyltransferase involved in cell wall biosynthesis
MSPADTPFISVVLCTRNPDLDTIAKVFAGLRNQSLARGGWELIVVDNGSQPPLATSLAHLIKPFRHGRVIPEMQPGLTPARLTGIGEARGQILVFVDDDNILDGDFLTTVAKCFSDDNTLTAAGGTVRPLFASPPPDWSAEFFPLLAIKDHGDSVLVVDGDSHKPWPDFAPVGAGLCIRKTAAENYARIIKHDTRRIALDRKAGLLTSGGDNDMVFTAFRAGGRIAYFPSLGLTHLIPDNRLDPVYLGQLNYGIQRSWIRVLTLHHACAWGPLSRWSARLRIIKAWFVGRAWTSPAARIRWLGACGHFDGRTDLR